MAWQAPYSLIVASVVMFSGLTAVSSDIFVIPRIETQSGYDNNRSGESSGGEGSPFWQASPGLDVMILGEKTETSFFFDYHRTQYTESDLESRDEASAVAQLRYLGGRNEAGINFGGGLYSDKAFPEDNCTFWKARPYFVRTLESLPVELILNADFRQMFYDISAYTSTSSRVDSLVCVRSALRWNESRFVTLWTEIYAEYNASDALEAEYSGFGGVLGCELHPTPRLNCGAWAGIGTRSYEQTTDGTNRRDTPLPVAIWMTYRLRPWLELFSTANWETNASTIPENDYSRWQVGCGLRILFELEVQPR